MNADATGRLETANAFWAAAAIVTTLRILTLVATPLGLGPDEAQYWFWAQTPDFGYFSKPPLIAWAISLTTGLFGDGAWAARLSAPLFHLGAAAFLFHAAKRLYGERAGFWAGLGWLLMPGVVLSSFVIATDAPLLFFWSAALFFLVRIVSAERSGAPDFAALGAAVGFGMLAKYAMIYFPIALLLMCAAPGLRRRLLTPRIGLAALIAAAIVAPNVLWNAAHDFQTLSHTAANANWGADLFKPLALLAFLAGQFAVFGPVSFAILIYLCARAKRIAADDRSLMLLILSLTPLVIVAVQAFLSRAHANWAAAAYPAATILVAGALLAQDRSFWLKASAALNAAVWAGFMLVVTAPQILDGLGFSRAVRDLRGWERQTEEIIAYAPGYDAVVMDNRYLMGEMLYHQRGSAAAFAALSPNGGVNNHYEAFLPFDPERMKRVLFVTSRDDEAHVAYRFRTIKRIGSVEVDVGSGKRRYALYELSGYIAPEAD
jgi:4-amino-4-deoxy-L-arabinose transferase-like glycosyltransferase